ncbi:MAG: MoaD/ThiS family protein [Nitrospinota bacterium]
MARRLGAEGGLSAWEGEAVITVVFQPPLTRITGQKKVQVPVDALDRSTLKEVLNHLAGRNPKLKTALFDDNGELSHEYNCFLNGENLRAQADGRAVTDAPVQDGDEVVILMPIAGG